MRYIGIIVLMALLGVAWVSPAMAQQRTDSVVDRLLSQVAGDDDERKARRPTVVMRDRNGEARDDTRGRSKTGRDDGDRRERAQTGTRTERRDGTGRSARTERAERTERPSARTTSRDRDYDRDGDYDRRDEARRRGIDPRDVYGRQSKQKKGNGPPFCRSGEGHPKHGQQWCIDKGWGLGNDGRIFDTRREDRRYPTRTGDRTILDDILGRRNN